MRRDNMEDPRRTRQHPNTPSARHHRVSRAGVIGAGVAVLGVALLLLGAGGGREEGMGDVVGALLMAALLVGFAAVAAASLLAPGPALPRSVGIGALVGAGLGAGGALLARWTLTEVVVAVLFGAFLVGCMAWGIAGALAERRALLRGERHEAHPVPVAGTAIASGPARWAARGIDGFLIYLLGCVAEWVWAGADENGFWTVGTTPFLVVFVSHEVLGGVAGVTVGRWICRYRIVAVDRGWPRIGLVRAVGRALLVPLGVVNAAFTTIGVNLLHRVHPVLDLVDGPAAGTVAMPVTEVSRLSALGGAQRESTLARLDEELCRPLPRTPLREVLVAIGFVAVGVLLVILAGGDSADEPRRPLPTVPSLPTIPTITTVSIPGAVGPSTPASTG